MTSSSYHVVIMGVSGSGKTTVGHNVAALTGNAYRDGDDMHPAENIAKMSAGTPLNDADRWPWLTAIGTWLAEQPSGTMVGCSALKRSYRDLLREHCPDVVFVHVAGEFGVLAERMQHRVGHFMPASLLQSQFDTLEPLEADEAGAVFDVDQPEEEIARQVADYLAA